LIGIYQIKVECDIIYTTGNLHMKFMEFIGQVLSMNEKSYGERKF